jgi:hypothetical protein
MQTMLPVLCQSSGSSQFCQLAGSKAALSIHLEKALLGMEIP